MGRSGSHCLTAGRPDGGLNHPQVQWVSRVPGHSPVATGGAQPESREVLSCQQAASVRPGPSVSRLCPEKGPRALCKDLADRFTHVCVLIGASHLASPVLDRRRDAGDSPGCCRGEDGM